jgi:hypothetical protein
VGPRPSGAHLMNLIVECEVQPRGAHLLGALEAELAHNSRHKRWLVGG